jgi:small-conductance mechanosensitive channel/CRP-like cAMP-binding protein
MPYTDLTTTLLLAAGAGLAVAVLLWLLRGHEPVKRVRLWLTLAILAAGLYFVLQALGVPPSGFLLRLVAAAGLLLAVNALLHLFDLLVWDYLLGRRRRVVVPRFATELFNFFVLAAAALAVLSVVFQVDLTTLLVTSTVISAVIGLSLQDLLGNVIAGLALQMERPFVVGDWVQTSDQEGQVTQMNWRTLTLRTRDNCEVVIPNANAARQDIINYSRPTPLQAVHAQVAVAYRHPPGTVREVLERALSDAPGVQTAPPVEVRVRAYAESAIEYDIKYWIVDAAARDTVSDEVMTRMWYALQRARLSVPFPQREVTLHTLPADYEAVAHAELHNRLVGVLNRLTLFTPLSEQNIQRVARSAVLHSFTAGEALVRQGDPGDSLYVICTGSVHVDHRQEDGHSVTLHSLGPDDFFGEMSLLTGAPRTASVVAETDCEVVVVDRAGFRDVLTNDPTVLDALTEQLAERTRRVENLVPVAADAGADSHRRAKLGEQIRKFFGI